MALTVHEENVLRQIAKNATPMAVVNPHNQERTGLVPEAESNWFARMIRRYASAPPARVENINDDPAVQSKLKHCGYAGTPGQLYSLGISREQAMSLSRHELQELISAAQARDDVREPVGTITAPPTTPRRTINAVLT